MLVDMRKNTLFKHMLLIVICEVMLMLSACDRKSVDDLYNMTETSIEDDMQFLESVSDWKEVKEEYATWGTTEDKPELVQQGDSCTVSFSGIEGTSTLTFQVENTILSDDFNDLKKFTTEDSYDKVENYLRSVDNDNRIDKDGKLNTDNKGMEQKAVFIKLRVKNENNKAYEFCISNLKICCIDSQDNDLLYRELRELNILDTPDAWTRHGTNKITIQPGESREIVAIGFINSELINRYYTKYDMKERKAYYKDFVTEELPLDKLYMTTRFIDYSGGDKGNKGFRGNKALLKLEVE